MTKAVESGMPKLRIEESAARRQARVDRGEEVVVGVNKYVPENPELVDVLDIDNTKVPRAADRQARAGPGRPRRRGRARPRSTALTEGARGDGNLLGAVHRGRPGPGHRRRDLATPWRRCSAATRPRSVRISGVYGAAYEGDDGLRRASRPTSRPSPTAEGRRPRMLVVKMGQDGHDRGAKVIATAFADLGFDVDVGPLFQTPGRGRPRRRRERRARGRRVAARPPATRRSCPSSSTSCKAAGAGDVLVVVRRRHPARRTTTFLARRRRGRHLRPRHQHPRRRPPGPRPPPRPLTASRHGRAPQRCTFVPRRPLALG